MLARCRLAAALTTMTVAGALAVPALAGDEAAKPPEQILADAQAVLDAAPGGVRSVGTSVGTDGETTRSSAVFSASGPLELTAETRRGTSRMIVVGRRLYVRQDASLWRSLGMPKRRLRGIERRWFVSSTDERADHAGYLDTVGCLMQPHGTLTTRTDTLDGQPVVVLTDAGDQPGTAPGELTVADATPASPLRATQTGPRRAGGPRQGRCANGDEVDTTRAAATRLTILTTTPQIHAPRHATKLSQQLALLVVLLLGHY